MNLFTKRPRSTRFTALVLCLALFLAAPCFMSGSMPISAAGSAYWNSQVDAIKSQQKDHDKIMNSISSKLENASSDKADLEALRALQKEEITAIEKEMDLLNQLMMTYSMQMEEKKAEIRALEETMRKNFDTFCKRLVFMHESGQQGYLDFLFNSGDFSDFLSRGEIMNDFIEYDTNLISSLKQNYESVQTMQKEVALLLKEAEKTHAQYEERTLVLQAKIEVYNKKISDYETALKAIREEYEAAKEREAKLNADLEYAKDQYDTAYKQEQAAASGGSGIKNPGIWGSKYTGRRFPCPIPAGTYIKTQPYGYGHGGVDLATFNGWSAMVPIYAAESGVVTESYNHYSWGEMVKISHGDLDVGKDVYTLYAHMKEGSRTVKVGDYVNKGDLLGYVGSTGNSTGPHLHFELYIGGSSTSCRCNPEAY